MSAILFGSIGTLVETSEVQRAAFNEAFKQHGLDWNWSREEYQQYLVHSGGRHRIESYAKAKGETVDAAAIHSAKSAIFQNTLREGGLCTREGVASVIEESKQRGIKVALVTTTSRANIDALLMSVAQTLVPSDLDLIVDVTQVDGPKPSASCYEFAIAHLHENADRCIVIEDNVDGVTSAKSAGLACIAFPGSNTADHDFSAADTQMDRLQFASIEQFLLPAVVA